MNKVTKKIKITSCILMIVMLFSILSTATVTSAGAVASSQNSVGGNSFETAQEIDIDSAIEGSLGDDEKVYYKFTVKGDSSVKIKISFTTEQTISPEICVYNSDRERIFRDIGDENETNNYTIYFDPGTYYYRIKFDNSGSYTITQKSEVLNNDDIYSNHTMESAQSISFNKTYKGVITDEEKTDYYKINVLSPIKLNYTLRHNMDDKLGMCIYNELGEIVYDYDDAESDGKASLQNAFNVNLDKGTYYVKLYVEYDNMSCEYFLTMMDMHSVSGAKISAIPTQYYSGKSITPAFTVKCGSKVLKKNTEYTVKYTSNIIPGYGEITVTGKGNYYGTINKKFRIILKDVKVNSLKNKNKKAVTINYSKNTNASGYQIVYSTSKKFSGAKSLYVSGSKNISKKISGLKKGKRYYFKVRAYCQKNSRKFYSKYSNTMSVVVRK
ncbi:MAG: hypothetical protein PUE26_00410 [Ruminococcus sp.]|nr:hypothetical protein [Ruminococcus sp.]MDD6708610.1 hypothetical protein [Ruminococcus sp.]